ncbi:MarR family transcriptional regulator [Paracoccus aurantiacus]|uniref:MarR family transcriptional regulator n=2 Tax=Paracoccus aurantiacus TaxID=2599412 RepID=A0A5C6SBZ7_9RHOB|nr:MarR family transcriptional regulator [Paracoccus aurantiacus]TXB71353.1 MarR family transcriptional regulator [Paracoccus aurantiacus]
MPGHLIRRLHQISTQIFTQRVQAEGSDLTAVQFAALDALESSPGIDQAGLAGAVAKDRATIGAVVDRLVQKGLIARKISERDKRARELWLTESGTAALRALAPVVGELQRDILPGLSDDEYRDFIALAARAVTAAEAAESSGADQT